jgi:hypothetical protein
MVFLVLSLLIQAALIVHVIKTGRNMLWIWAIALLPLAGPLAYTVVELLPSLFSGGAARRARTGVQKVMDPDRDLREASAQVALSGNVDARRRLADEHFERGQFADAINAYGAGLKGIFEHDPTLLLGLARAQFAAGQFTAARDSLDRLRRENPDFKSVDGHLLYARSLEEMGELDRAQHEYEALQGTYPGAEAQLRYGLLLKRMGKTAESSTVLRELLASAELAPKHYRKAQAEWLDLAKRG